MPTLTIDNHTIQSRADASVLDAARAANIHIPTLCSHPDLPIGRGTKSVSAVYRGATRIESATLGEFDGCGLCLVEVDDEIAHACDTRACDGMSVKTNSGAVRRARQQNLGKILATHPHACLTCPNREGCDRIQCSMNVPVPERCCAKFAYCELRRVADYIGIPQDTPRFVYQNLPIVRDEPLFARDYNLCIGCTRCVRVCSDVRGVGALGFVRDDGRAMVGALAPTLAASACKFCTACVEVCPTGALMDVGLPKAERDAALVPCRAACPAMTDVPRYVRLIAQGKYAEATAVVRERAPLPTVLGYVCPHPCEDACRRAKINAPISICALKRFAAENDNGLWKQSLQKPTPTGKRIAVIGSGPAGLTAAYFLTRRGHAVTVFEAASEAGGMMRYGIPTFRLPREILDRDIAEIAAQGVEIKTNARVQSLDAVRAQHDAVFIAIGASLSKRIPLEGTELDGVLWGVEFLQQAVICHSEQSEESPAVMEILRSAQGDRPNALGRVVVIGGGNVAIDVAMTALRLGATSVQLACLESRAEMPAFESEIQEAIAEEVQINVSWGPKKILGTNGRVTGIELKRCTAVFDEQKRFNPSYDETITTTMECDTVILAIGQTTDLSFLNGGVATRGAGIQVDDATLATNVLGVFAGGEVSSGSGSVIQAIAAGRKAARAIDRYLDGAGVLEEKLVDPGYGAPFIGRDEGFAERARAAMPALPLDDSRKTFALINLGFGEMTARAEAARCLQCDLRLTIVPPVLPPAPWIALTAEKIAAVPAADGVLQLLDADKNVIRILGTQNLRQALEEQLATNPDARYFIYEEDRMYTQRESELLQHYLQQHGKLPPGNDELADLF
jgi:NADPH-dependent glutamate synthase beta subunit-like oxidoreductase